MKKNPEDTGKTVALVALMGAIGYGLYSWLTGKKKPLVPGVSQFRNLSASISRRTV